MEWRRGIRFGVLQAVLVVAGFGFGCLGGYVGDPPHIFTFLGFLSLGLLIAGGIAAVKSEFPRIRWLGPSAAIGVALYCCVVMTSEPFLRPPPTLVELLPLIAWVLPLLFAGVEMAHWKCWWGAAGVSVFLFDCVALLTYNLHILDGAAFLLKLRR